MMEDDRVADGAPGRPLVCSQFDAAALTNDAEHRDRILRAALAAPADLTH